MKRLDILLFEWKHFKRSPFKIIAILLFIFAGVYGLKNGANLFQKQEAEIERITQETNEEKQVILDEHFETGNLENSERPWINYGVPYWAIRYASPHHFKKPSPAIVYSIGQSEQYGFYKKIGYWASPYDEDLAEEITNPERLQVGTLDFSFTLLFLMPLVLLVLLYNVKSFESEQGFMPLIRVQTNAQNRWTLYRVLFYVILVFIVVVALVVYGGFLTDVYSLGFNYSLKIIGYASLYLLFWSVLYLLIIIKSKSIIKNTLLMTGVFLIFAFIIPATVHQVLSIQKPANLMTSLIDVREEEDELFKESDEALQVKLNELYPEIQKSKAYQDPEKRVASLNRSVSSLVNELKKSSIEPIEKEYIDKNTFIENTFWFNPVSFFQNQFNSISSTHFDDYQNYRNEIQSLIDLQIDLMVNETWNEETVDKERFLNYSNKIALD